MKRTKIVATISDKRCEIGFLRELYEAGMNVVRLNTAHQTLDEAMKVVRNVRAVSDQIALLIDTKGPEVRTCDIVVPVRVEKGEIIFMTGDRTLVAEKLIHVSYEHFVRDVQIGDKILVDDGDVELIVRDKKENCLELEASNPGEIKDKKSIWLYQGKKNQYKKILTSKYPIEQLKYSGNRLKYKINKNDNLYIKYKRG